MAKRSILAGSTDQSIDVFIPNSSSITGAGLTGLVFNSAGLSCYYRKGATGAATALALVTQTVAGVHADGGFVEVDATNMPGVYRLDLSDTMLASTPVVTIMLKGATNMAPTLVEIDLVAYNPLDATRMGLAALPNAAANANGGLPILSVGGTTLAYTVSTLTTYTGNTPQTGDAFARLGVNGAGLTALGDTRIANLDAAVSSRMATYTQPTGFLAATFPTTVASTTNITAGTITTATNVTTVNGLAANVITTTALANGAITGAKFGANALGAVWDEATSGHTTPGTYGVVTTAAALAAALWNALTSGLTTIGSIGKLLVDNINATIGSRLPTASYEPTSVSLAGITDLLQSPVFGLQVIKDTVSLGATAANQTIIIGHLTDIKGTGFVVATHSLAAIRARGDAAWVTATSVTVSDKTGFKLASDGVDAIVIESGLNARQALSLSAGALAGVISGAGSGTVVIRGAGVATTRITAQTDVSGNRTSIIITPPA